MDAGLYHDTDGSENDLSRMGKGLPDNNNQRKAIIRMMQSRFVKMMISY
jgi:hypothetical protein